MATRLQAPALRWECWHWGLPVVWKSDTQSFQATLAALPFSARHGKRNAKHTHFPQPCCYPVFVSCIQQKHFIDRTTSLNITRLSHWTWQPLPRRTVWFCYPCFLLNVQTFRCSEKINKKCISNFKGNVIQVYNIHHIWSFNPVILQSCQLILWMDFFGGFVARLHISFH